MKIEDIKYKAYVKELNKIFNVELMELCNTCGVSCVAVAHNSTDDLVQYDTDEVILLPFTGFKDKNGVEIYEGDIVEITRFGDKIFRLEVKFKEGIFNLYDSMNDSWGGLPVKDCEIKGNVYENPELMKDGIVMYYS